MKIPNWIYNVVSTIIIFTNGSPSNEFIELDKRIKKLEDGDLDV
jgi:hypothetical protein